MLVRRSPRHPKTALWAPMLWAVAISACAAEMPGAHLLGADRRLDPIVGGELESGWSGVGALTAQYPGYGYLGAYCTGVLIRADWVLTAAHCLVETDGVSLEPAHVSFFVGENANPISGGRPPTSGGFLQADAFHVHPAYDADKVQNDIGLVHLAEPAYGAPVYPLNESALGGQVVGWAAFYVGYGATEGVHQRGSGRKRSAYVDIIEVYDDSYVGEYAGSGICFGDSGGPGFLRLDDTWRIVGINSAVAGAADGSGDPCKNYSFHTRVDRYATWIAQHLGRPPPDCRRDATVCFCESACRSDGTCNGSACQVRSCEEIYSCVLACNGVTGCHTNCYLEGTDLGRWQFDSLVQCMLGRCYQAGDDDGFEACVSERCVDEVAECFPVPPPCPITGGGCPAGQACYLNAGGTTSCFATEGRASGAACDPRDPGMLQCADGLGCWARGQAGSCRPFCLSDDDCAAGIPCTKPVFKGRSDIGMCACDDVDGDGSCPPIDCNDGDPTVFPGAQERCGDGRDNDCDGLADELCGDEDPRSRFDEDLDASAGGGCASQAGGLPAVWAVLACLLGAVRSRGRKRRQGADSLREAGGDCAPILAGGLGVSTHGEAAGEH